MRFHDPELARQRKGVLDSLIREMRDKYSWDEQPCAVCGEDPVQGETISKWGIEMRFCPSCDHLFTSPRMEERGVPDLYGSFYWEQYQVAIGSPSIQERMQFDYDNGQHKLLRDVLPFRTSGRFLDVGASSGGLVKKAQEAGFQAAGIEPAGEIAQMARKVHGVEMFEGTLIDQQFDAESFDVITLHDVLEHLFEPVRDLREMVRVLAPGGILAIETPTSSSLNYLDQGIDWTTISPLEHVHLFNEANIARLVEGMGLEILDLYSPHEDNWILVAQKPL